MNEPITIGMLLIYTGFAWITIAVLYFISKIAMLIIDRKEELEEPEWTRYPSHKQEKNERLYGKRNDDR